MNSKTITVRAVVWDSGTEEIVVHDEFEVDAEKINSPSDLNRAVCALSDEFDEQGDPLWAVTDAVFNYKYNQKSISLEILKGSPAPDGWYCAHITTVGNPQPGVTFLSTITIFR
jgi:hypothetical protein